MMVMDLSLYEGRLGATSLAEGFLNRTEVIVNENFDKAISYRKIVLDGVESDCQFKRSKKHRKLEIWLRPYTKINRGMYVFFEDKNYLVTEIVENEIYPKSEIELCNNTLRWKDDIGNLFEYDCIIKGDSFELDDSTSSSNFIISSSAELTIVIPYNEDTKKIKVEQRFIFDNLAYTVSSLDFMSNTYKEDGVVVGTIELKLAPAGLTETDDTTNGVADDSGNSGWGDW